MDSVDDGQLVDDPILLTFNPTLPATGFSQTR